MMTVPTHRAAIALLTALLAGCGAPASQPEKVSVEQVSGTLSSVPDTNPEPTGLAAFGETLPFGISRDEPFAEVKLFATVTLQFQRIIALQEQKLHTELKLTDAQIQAFTAHGDDVKSLQTELQNIRPEERESTMLEVFVPKAEAYKALVEKELSAEQQFLVLQKIVQKQRGAIALLLPGVPDHLAMTDEQRTAIFEIVDENRKSVNIDEVKGNPIEIMKLLRRANAARAEAEGHLSEAQKKKWQALLGK